ncbi:hypothetical protein BH24ACT19_BH24ACT19_19270 [soil metagenome]
MLLAHLAATLLWSGVVWFVQVVHYPLFEKVGAEKFALYSKSHSRLTGYVVGPPMLAEAGTALLLLVLRRPEGVPLAATFVGLILVALIWASTALLQVPRHTTLGSGLDEGDHKGLVLSNWVRTAAPAHGGLVLWMAARAIG